MKFIDKLLARFRKPQPPKPAKGLHCACCHERMEKGDNFTVLSVKHKDCADRKRNALPHPLLDVLDKGL